MKEGAYRPTQHGPGRQILHQRTSCDLYNITLSKTSNVI
jgi:hypothetical protein